MIPENWIAMDGIKLASREPPHIRTVFGSRLYILGMDKPQRAEGDQWDGGVLDESCDLKPGIFDRNVLPMLIHRNGWCWRIGVPKRQGPSSREFRDFFRLGASGADEDLTSFHWPSSDILPENALRFAKKRLDARDYREQFDGLFQRLSGGIFHAFDSKRNVRRVTYNPDRLLVVGMDFNVDPMCWVYGHPIEGKVPGLEWFGELHVSDTNTPACLDMLWSQFRKHQGGFEFYPDAAGDARKTSAYMSDIQHIAAHKGLKSAPKGRVIHAIAANPALEDRFSATNSLLCNADGDRRMFFDSDGCPNTILDFEHRRYKPGTRDPADGPTEGHCSDAAGYAVWQRFPELGRVDDMATMPFGVVV